MKKMQKTLVALTLTAAVMTTGATIASMQESQNQNGNQNSNSNRRSNRNMNGNMNSSMGSNMNGNMTMSPEMNSNMSMNGNMSMGGNMGAMMMVSDTEFANMAAQGGQAEIQMAQLALQKATNKNVREYAQEMIKDHTKASRNLDKVAAKKQMTLTKTPNEVQMQMMSQLQAASGAEFDRMYIEMAGVMAHQKMQALYQSEISGGTDNNIKAFARKTLPTVQKHLRMAQGMANGAMMMNGGSMNSNMNMNSNRRNRNSNGNANSNNSNR